MSIEIRAATPDDAGAVLALVTALAVYEKEADKVKMTEAGARKALEAGHLNALLGFADGKPAAMALYFFNFSSWTGKRGLFLEDLFVAPELRGQGVGLDLLKQLARMAVAADCGRMEWNVLELLKRRDAKVSDLVVAERAFAEVQEELDSARSTREEFSGRVQMSVVSAEYQAAGLSGRAGRRPVAEALASAGRTLGTSVASLIHFAVAAIPWAALLLLLMWASRRLLAWRRDKSNRKPEAAPD